MLVGAAVGAVVIGGGIVIYNNREAVGDAIEKSMEMQGDMEKQNRRKEQEYIKGLKRYEQKGIPVYIDGKKPEEEDWEKIFQIQEDGGFYMSDFIGLEDGKLQEIHFDKVYNH